MDLKIIIRKILAQTKNTYTLKDIGNLARGIKKSKPEEMKNLWFEFQNKFNVTIDKIDEILIDKLKGIYQVDLKKDYKNALDDLISIAKKRKTWF